MMEIFPTVAIFGNLDLTTGKKERPIRFYPSRAISQHNGIIDLANGISFDSIQGTIDIRNNTEDVKYFVTTSNLKNGHMRVEEHVLHPDGQSVAVYMKSYGQIVVMDEKTFHSTYVQMFMLEKYNKDLFELVVSSPYSKIYRLKK